jgi:hypothetical protein
MYIGIVFVFIILGTSTMASLPKPPSDRCILIKVLVADRDDVATLSNMGLDIWEFQQDGAIVRVTDDERNRIKESGFIIEIITEDVYEYTETISKEQILLRLIL